MRTKILLTGATGFVGRRFLEYNAGKFEMITVSLRETGVNDIDFTNVAAVVHMAGLAHQMQKVSAGAYFEINTKLTGALATHAKKSGVPHFIYLSSVKVYGEGSQSEIDELTECKPQDDYGKSKLVAEQLLTAIQNDEFRVAIVRPPLIFGPHVKGNMVRLMQLVEKNKVLPFKGINNKRSMVFLDNLIEFLNAIIQRKASGVFIPAEDTPISTEQLVRQIEISLGKKSRLIAFPKPLLWIVKFSFPALHKRLFGSFVVQNRISNQRLNFSSPYSTEFGLSAMVHWFKNKK